MSRAKPFRIAAIVLAVIALALVFPAARAAEPAFEFHSNFWINLHHFLYEQAGSKTPEPSDAAAWNAALDYYRGQVVQHDLLNDEMAAINNVLSDLELALPSLQRLTLDPKLAAVLESAAPVYRQRWWKQHDRANHAWIDAVQPLLAEFGPSMMKELAGAYQTEWPSRPVPTDVAEYASWAGAYTSIEPTHIFISSTDTSYQGAAALEMLFHEASHGMFAKISNALNAELESQNKLFRRRGFWHMVLFYTAGEFARRHLDGYTPYAVKNGLFERGWAGTYEILEKYWKPYLDGEVDLKTAVRGLVGAYGVPKEK